MARTGSVPTVNHRPSGSVLAADPLARVAALPGVREAADTARAAVDTLLRHRVLRRQSAEVTAEASLRAARACAALEGHEISLDQLRGMLSAAGDPPQAPTDQAAVPAGGPDPTVLGTVRLYAELGMLAPAWERAPRQALARMHVLLGRGVLPDEELGRPRADAGTRPPSDPLRLGPPPSSMEASVRLDGLTGLLVAPTTAPAIIVAAVVHGELLALRPFGVLDGVIARAAARLVLISRGLDPKALTATDVGHLEIGQEAAAPDHEAVLDYRAAADAYVHGGAEGVIAWLRHCSRALELAARDSLAVCEAIARA
ncbi:conserved hypothetical protein [Frankia canadensis]|uniref:Fido domain-containing protein n=1 Tax=Frankia canadensis TaxID=1836972 RepID=A0A2I2KY74_9ACTN|nr:hypothetical protein [Frankia canadensis]SNQ50613.1 conserved hypothetical protein [Frankia canadensis]SOU57903.1 conserved hypothetical protein [Frankia canadensis]